MYVQQIAPFWLWWLPGHVAACLSKSQLIKTFGDYPRTASAWSPSRSPRGADCVFSSSKYLQDYSSYPRPHPGLLSRIKAGLMYRLRIQKHLGQLWCVLGADAPFQTCLLRCCLRALLLPPLGLLWIKSHQKKLAPAPLSAVVPVAELRPVHFLSPLPMHLVP